MATKCFYEFMSALSKSPMFNFDLVKQVYEHVTENNFCNMNLANESQL